MLQVKFSLDKSQHSFIEQYKELGVTEKKGRIVTNVIIEPMEQNGLSKQSVADCLQTRPIDHQSRLMAVHGELASEVMARIDQALGRVFSLT